MANPRSLPAALGVIATLPTTATLAILIILARSAADGASSVRVTATAAAVLEATVLAAIISLALSRISQRGPISSLGRLGGLWFGAALFLCALAAAVSVSSFVRLSQVADDPQSTALGSRATDFLVGSSVALGLAFASQVVFLAFHLVAALIRGPETASSNSKDEGWAWPPPRVKSIPYHATSPNPARVRGRTSFESKTRPGSSSGRSATETVSSGRSSLSQVVRPISSKTRLLSGCPRSVRWPASLDLPAFRDRQSRSTDDGFDSWDTSAVDPQNRRTVLESSSSSLSQFGRFLETIPASPTPSRSPSPGTPLDICKPPRTRRRSRSYSPLSTRTIRAKQAAFTQHALQSEANIHPLFRSDSPTPPPSATPGTVIVAAPNAGQVISDRQSIRSMKSMRRLRSESLPVVSSPLSRAGSCQSSLRSAESSSTEIREEDEEAAAEAGAETERKMTPPIPDWILSAGSRASLTIYNTRKLRMPGDGSEENPAAERQLGVAVLPEPKV